MSNPIDDLRTQIKMNKIKKEFEEKKPAMRKFADEFNFQYKRLKLGIDYAMLDFHTAIGMYDKEEMEEEKYDE